MLAQDQMGMLTNAYAFLNDIFFDGELPDVMLTMQRRRGAMGYASKGRFINVRGRRVWELALNPDHFDAGHASHYLNEREAVQTLLHEMVHIWQDTQPDPPRKAYHDKRFAAKMRECGLQTSSTGKPGGKDVGQHMSDYVLEHGRFDIAFRAMKKIGFRLEWRSIDPVTAATLPVTGSVSSGTVAPAQQPDKRKYKYSCTVCGSNCWGKKSMILACAGMDGKIHEPALMGMAA